MKYVATFAANNTNNPITIGGQPFTVSGGTAIFDCSRYFTQIIGLKYDTKLNGGNGGYSETGVVATVADDCTFTPNNTSPIDGIKVNVLSDNIKIDELGFTFDKSLPVVDKKGASISQTLICK